MTMVHKECDDPACECCNASRLAVDDWLETQKKKNKCHQTARVEESSLSVLLTAETILAIQNLHGIGLACQRCGWGIDNVLWCTEQHKITPRLLLALGEILEGR